MYGAEAYAEYAEAYEEYESWPMLCAHLAVSPDSTVSLAYRVPHVPVEVAADTYTCPMRRERRPSPDARPGHPPAHTRTVIAYTITRDAIRPGPFLAPVRDSITAAGKSAVEAGRDWNEAAGPLLVTLTPTA